MKAFQLPEFLKTNLYLIVLFIFTIPTFFLLLRPGFLFMQDDLQAFRIHQMDKCFQDLQIPCRWIPDMGFQYGYPQFNFYPPSVYYLGEIIHLLGFQFIDAVKILFILGFILSTIGMYLLLKEIFGEWPAFVGALLYTYVPYKSVEVYVRGAMNEFWALVIFPFIFLYIYKVIQKRTISQIIGLAISIGFLLLTHNLMTMIFAPVALIFAITCLTVYKKWSSLKALILSGLLGLGLAAFFTLPVLIEGKYVHLESLLGGYFDYRQHFVNINRLFISTIWGYGSSTLGQTEPLSLSTGIVQWLVGILAVILAVINFNKNKSLAIITLIMASVEVLVLFMIHQKSSFIWEKIPPLVYLQFPWRFLTDSIFLLSFLSGAAIYFLEKTNFLKIKKLALTLGTIFIIISIILYLPIFKPREWYNISDQEKFNGPLWQKQLTISIFDYLPIYAQLPPPAQAPTLPEILSGEAEFISYERRSDYQTGQVLVKKDSKLRLPLFDFPGMRVTIDNQVVKHYHDDCTDQEYCLGLISFFVPQGNHQIKAELTDTSVRLIGNALTATSLLICLVLIIKFRNKII